MKQLKITSLWLVLTAVSLFAGCAKFDEPDAMVGKTRVTVTVSPSGTRTVNDGSKTLWAEGDEISVFQTISGGSEFTNEKFTVTDVPGGIFTGSISGTIEASKSYDWYAVYPYIASIPSPANKGSKGYITVGENMQIQNGPDSRAHLAGSKMSAWACAKGVAGDGKVSLVMHQFASVIAVKVTNLTGKEVEISSVNITADNNIAGTYFADITGESPVLVPSGEGYVYKSVGLNVSNAVLSAGTSGRFYMAVTPFTASGLKVSVNGVEKTLSFGKDVEFQAGHIKTIPFELDEFSEMENLSVSEAYARVDDGKTYLIHGTVGKIENTTYGNFNLSDDSKSIYIYGLLTPDGQAKKFSTLGVKEGDNITVRGSVVTYDNTVEVKNAIFVSSDAPADIELSSPAVQSADATSVSVDCRSINAPSGAAFDAAWIAEWIKDCSFEGGKLTVTFETNTSSSQRSADIAIILNDAQGYELVTKTITLTQNGTGEDSSWTRVTAVSDITSGGTFIIGYEATANSGVLVPMRNEGSANSTTEGFMYAGTGTGSSSDGSTIDMSDVSDSERYSVEIVSSTAVPGAVCIKVGNLFVGGENTKNKCKLYSAQSANTSFEASIAENDVVTLKIGACSSYNTLQYNVSSPRFALYTGGQKNLVLYKKSGGGSGEGQFTVRTLNASGVTSSTATLGASYSNATQVPSIAYFMYGTSSSALTKTAYCNENLTSLSGSFSASLYGLSASTTYYYKAYVQVGDTTLGGAVSSFTTSSASSGGSTSTAGWFELPSIADSDHNRIDDKNSTYYYAYHKFSNGSSKRRNYSVCYSSQHHCPMWVAAPRHDCYEGSSGRTGGYGKDPDIPANIQYNSSDTGGGCNKGHMLGSAERTCSKEANKQVFYYTNIAPQYSSGFNNGGGGWNKLEDYIDTKVCADTLYEVVGCYFEAFTDGYGYSASPKTISYGGRNDVHCPTMFYYAVLRTKNGNTGKAVKDCSADQLQCVAFVRSHNNGLKGQAVTQKEMMSISDLEKLTGFEYFVNVPNAPKGTFNPSDWL